MTPLESLIKRLNDPAQYVDAIDEAETMLRTQAARIAELEKALEPFAEVGRMVSDSLRDDYSPWGAIKGGAIAEFTVFDLREAARVKGAK